MPSSAGCSVQPYKRKSDLRSESWHSIDLNFIFKTWLHMELDINMMADITVRLSPTWIHVSGWVACWCWWRLACCLSRGKAFGDKREHRHWIFQETDTLMDRSLTLDPAPWYQMSFPTMQHAVLHDTLAFKSQDMMFYVINKTWIN